MCQVITASAGVWVPSCIGYPTAQMQSALASLYGAQANSLLGSGLSNPVTWPLGLFSASGTTTLSPFASVTNFPFNLTPGSGEKAEEESETHLGFPEARKLFCRNSRSPASRT